MGLHLRNSLSGEVEPFEPRDESVSMYFCGLTVSDRAHLGHARSWVHVDVLRRWLDASGYEVRHVENFTDVNEKIVARVGERPEWDDEAAVADHFIERTLADMRSLNLRRASAYPRVTEHIDEIIDLIERLLDAGYAYETDGSVYFDVPAFEGYGQLVSPDLEDTEIDHPEKRHPADFALWKADGVEPADIEDHVKDPDLDLDAACDTALTWPSPWGRGRPGWHIECSAMSMAHLGETFDIHLAGRDIAFPHNENEIAQSEAATGESYARYWVHIDMLEIDDEKMSSSLENFFTVEQAVESVGPNIVRTLLLSASHDSRQAYTEEAITEAERRWDRLHRAHADAVGTLDRPDASATAVDRSLRSAVERCITDAEAALDDNLDTRGAFGAVDGLAGSIRDHLEAGAPYDYRGLLDAVDAIEYVGGDLLGLEFAPERVDPAVTGVLDAILAVRESLREAGEYAWADQIRDAFSAHGIEIEDTDNGPRARLSDRR